MGFIPHTIVVRMMIMMIMINLLILAFQEVTDEFKTANKRPLERYHIAMTTNKVTMMMMTKVMMMVMMVTG